ncbi:hypothetical protein BD413DRAFT_155894 [Trametes elegans]|nr:hypothetical protein BD413DRAFT_155894 [Trametes elegans]
MSPPTGAPTTDMSARGSKHRYHGNLELSPPSATRPFGWTPGGRALVFGSPPAVQILMSPPNTQPTGMSPRDYMKKRNGKPGQSRAPTVVWKTDEPGERPAPQSQGSGSSSAAQNCRVRAEGSRMVHFADEQSDAEEGCATARGTRARAASDAALLQRATDTQAVEPAPRDPEFEQGTSHPRSRTVQTDAYWERLMDRLLGPTASKRTPKPAAKVTEEGYAGSLLVDVDMEMVLAAGKASGRARQSRTGSIHSDQHSSHRGRP